ncbi:retrovirus-related pol polyprotein from transposon TNT 1-94 [Tanacetum coccineum]
MVATVSKVVITIAVVVVLKLGWKLLNWAWLMPKKLEKMLREQGYKGNSYKPITGDIMELAKVAKEARSKPMSIISHDISQHLLRKRTFDMVRTKTKGIHQGPELIKDILSRPGEFQRPQHEPLRDSIIGGLAASEGEKWTKHRHIINPAFHLESIKMKGLLGAQDAWEFVTTKYEEPTNAEIDATTANHLKALKEKRIKAKTALYLLFQSVDESGFEKIAVCAIEESKDLEDLTIEELAGSLEAHEQRKNKKKQESLDEALKTKATIKEEKALFSHQNNHGKGTNSGRHNTNRGRGRGRENNNHESEQTGKHFNQNSCGRGRRCRRGGQGYRLNIDCYNCGKRGHYAKDLRSPKRTEEKTNLVTEPQVEESGILLMAHEEQILEVDTMWYLDSGASNHMSGQKDLFVEMTEVVQGHVSFGDASKIDVKGRRKIRFLQNGKESTIEDVYYVPAIKSVIIALVKMCKNCTFKLNLNSVAGKCLKDDLSDKESVWHLRFGHLHFSGLKELTRKSMVHGLPNLAYDGRFCESCIFGKQTRSSFPGKATYEAKGLLELIHSDFCGPFSPVSFRNKRYFITFIDDFTRKCWVNFLEQKSEALETFKNFKAMVEKTTCQYIKALRSYRGGKYVSTPFIMFCEEEGIKRYDERTKAFRLYDPLEKKVTISRDLYVNEEST